ncbi:MAG: response regulator [Nevskiales bacterium]
MNDAALPPADAISTQAAGSPTGVFRRIARRLRDSLRIRHLLFLAFILVASLPVAVLALWQEGTAYRRLPAFVAAVVALAAASVMSRLIASLLAQPVLRLAHAAEAVPAGEADLSAPAFRGWVPLEIRLLGQAFATMLADRRRRHAQATLALQEAQTSNLARTEFLADFGHRIRTPLNGVVGMIELLRMSELPAEQQRYVDAAAQSSQALLRLIDDTLDLPNIEAGGLQLEHAPFHLPPVAGRELRALLDSTDAETIRILLVEDNATNLQVGQALLEALGCSVSTARNGLEAVAAYRDGSFDLVLMDCQMPEMDGYEAARAIRQMETFRGCATPIVALTAHALDDSRDKSLEAGMNDHLTKPFTMAALAGKLVRWLGPAAIASKVPHREHRGPPRATEEE